MGIPSEPLEDAVHLALVRYATDGADADRCVICHFPMSHPGPRGPSRLLLLVGVNSAGEWTVDWVHTWCAYHADELPASPEDLCGCLHPASAHNANAGAHPCNLCECMGWHRRGARARGW
jgi:hypothetical protein